MPCVSQKHLNLVQPCLQLAHIVLVECCLALYVAFAALLQNTWKNVRLLNCGRLVAALGILCLDEVAWILGCRHYKEGAVGKASGPPIRQRNE